MANFAGTCTSDNKGLLLLLYAMSWMCFVWCPVIADVLVQCVCVCSPVELC